MRKKGMSKERAAKTANTPRKQAGRKAAATRKRRSS
jgi:hypothetical protein